MEINCFAKTGYNNDAYFYQRPHQPMWTPTPEAYENGIGLPEFEDCGVLDGEAKKSTLEASKSGKMRSALFLILHTISSTVLLSSCAGNWMMLFRFPKRNSFCLPEENKSIIVFRHLRKASAILTWVSSKNKPYENSTHLERITYYVTVPRYLINKYNVFYKLHSPTLSPTICSFLLPSLTISKGIILPITKSMDSCFPWWAKYDPLEENYRVLVIF